MWGLVARTNNVQTLPLERRRRGSQVCCGGQSVPRCWFGCCPNAASLPHLLCSLAGPPRGGCAVWPGRGMQGPPTESRRDRDVSAGSGLYASNGQGQAMTVLKGLRETVAPKARPHLGAHPGGQTGQATWPRESQAGPRWVQFAGQTSRVLPIKRCRTTGSLFGKRRITWRRDWG